MKKKFSTKWKGSKLPRKQRKYRANAPLHIKRKLVSANLSKELRKKYGKRSFPLRKGDSVKILRGEFKRKTGKIDSVDLKKSRVVIEGIFRSKKEGSKVAVYFNPSNTTIRNINYENSDTNVIEVIEQGFEQFYIVGLSAGSAELSFSNDSLPNNVICSIQVNDSTPVLNSNDAMETSCSIFPNPAMDYLQVLIQDAEQNENYLMIANFPPVRCPSGVFTTKKYIPEAIT